MAELEITIAGRARRLALQKSQLVGGRNPDLDIPLDTTGASRRHFRIGKLREGGWAVEDLGSTNGTRVNGETVKRARLNHGDVIQIGRDCRIVFRDPAESAPEAPAPKKAAAPVPRRSRARRPSAKQDRAKPPAPRKRGRKPGRKTGLKIEPPPGKERRPGGPAPLAPGAAAETRTAAEPARDLSPVEITDEGTLNRLVGVEGALQKIQAQGKTVVFGRYVLEQRLSAGGMGVVVRAVDRRRKTPVALKILKTERVDERNISRFKQEAWAISAFNHPNIVQVRDLGEEAGMHYIAMDFVEGESLLPVAIRRELSYWHIAEIVRALADVLRLLHSRNIWHRDIKPQNVMLNAAGEIKLIDFGIATLERERDDALETGEGLIMGTPAFVSPEQVRREGEIDGRSDLYSLGAVFYYMLTGRRPFSGRSAVEILTKNLNDDPPHPFTVDEMIPSGLVDICLKLLRKDPGERVQSAEALLAELDGWRKSQQGRRALERHKKLIKVRAMREKAQQRAK